jgi:hypothetical protein
MKDINLQYRERSEGYSRQALELQARYDRLSFVRLGIFIAAVGAAIYLWQLHAGPGVVFTLLFIVAFYRFVRRHQSLKDKQLHNEYLALINRREEAALDHDYSPFDPGEEFIDADHPYSYDLDVFGDYSLFQYCNRASTAIGRGRLAEFLSAAAVPADIERRQEAVAELRGELDWRQHFLAYGMETEDSMEHIRLLKRWLDEPPFVSNDKRLAAALYLNPLWILAGLVLFALYLPWQAALLFLIPPALILRRTTQQVNRTHHHTTNAEQILSQYARLIAHIEGRDFQSPLLKELLQRFRMEGRTASKEIDNLSYIISQLNVRYNVFAILLNISALWDLQWVYRLEKWKARLHGLLPEWFDALQEFEALCSLANLHFNNPDWSFPLISDEPVLQAEAIGHPLIHSAKRVGNDIDIPTRGHIKLITGSNMAGKSTFLRTVGINIALAMAGAPVCARRLQLPLLKVYTSMRTQDALHESASSFYAELKRLKFIIEAVEKGENIFFLLDEILKGTNSRDRHTGSRALIRQLIKSKGAGLIATHDLELGQLESGADGAIENLCLEVEIKDDLLFFDYKLKKGVSRSFNATLLMKKMGIRIE